jgi:DNA (cytosine-5)-methyltransferase 1
LEARLANRRQVSMANQLVHVAEHTHPGEPAAWGRWARAVALHADTVGRPAPAPTIPGRNGRPRANPVFVEWAMMLPAGWVTDPGIGLTAARQLRALGNGVVPAQAALALRTLLAFADPAAPSGPA